MPRRQLVRRSLNVKALCGNSPVEMALNVWFEGNREAKIESVAFQLDGTQWADNVLVFYRTTEGKVA